VFALLDPPLWLLTAQAGDRRGGLIATFVNQASIPTTHPRVVVGLARQHFTWEIVESSHCFALHLLGEEHLDWVWRFGLHTGRDTDKFTGLEAQTSSLGNPRLPGVPAWLDCRVEASLLTGDRTLYLAEVVEAQVVHPAPLLTLKRMLQLAPPAQLRALKDQMERDQAIDAAAIDAWRKQ
jgi:flavin reductase (DIM6/NTAB) family NADH-FMN oxidoreductase RutF